MHVPIDFMCHLQQAAVFGYELSSQGLSSSAAEEQSMSVYMNIHTLQSSPPPATDIKAHANMNTLHEHDVNMLDTREY